MKLDKKRTRAHAGIPRDFTLVHIPKGNLVIYRYTKQVPCLYVTTHVPARCMHDIRASYGHTEIVQVHLGPRIKS